jgi:hypothetical protein
MKDMDYVRSDEDIAREVIEQVDAALAAVAAARASIDRSSVPLSKEGDMGRLADVAKDTIPALYEATQALKRVREAAEQAIPRPLVADRINRKPGESDAEWRARLARFMEEE